MKRTEEMLFALLRSSLNGSKPELLFFEGVTEKEWDECHKTAVAQGVMALAWDGVLHLPKELQPPLKLKLTWAMAVERYEAKYLRYCRTVDELSSFYAGYGISTIQLKGVGFSTLYPVPSHREGGDIDIYTCSSDTNRLSHNDANRLADTLMEQQGIEVEYHSYKHSNFYYKGIPIENHKSFLNVKEMKEAITANGILGKVLRPKTVGLMEGKVQVPSEDFNVLFIAFHALQHYGSGIALHHLCDWAMILKHYGLKLPQELDGTPFMNGIYGMTLLCNRHLGTSVPVSGGEKVAGQMMEEILNPPYTADVPCRTKAGIIIYKTKRLLHTFRLRSSVFDISFGGRIWSSIISHIRNPKTIFG